MTDHIAGSTTLGSFVVVINFICLFLVFAPICGSFIGFHKHPSDTLQHLNAEKKRNVLFRTWLYFNFLILWLDIALIVYYYAGPGKYGSTTASVDGEDTFVSIWTAAYCYLAQLFVNICAHEYQNMDSFLSSIAFHDAVSRQIFQDAATVTWTAKTGYRDREGEIVSTHTEQKSREYNHYKIAAVWKEGAFRFHQVEINDLLQARATRLEITVNARPGDQNTGLEWQHNFNSLKEMHWARTHDDEASFEEITETWTLNFFSKVCSKRTILIGNKVSFLLGLEPVYRLLLSFLLPEEHYVIEKHVFCSETEDAAQGPLQLDFASVEMERSIAN